MSIRRAPRPESNFYLLDKRISEDKRLSWAARGMLIFLLGKPDHWVVSVANLINETAESGKKSGRDAVYGTLKELEQAGYLTREKARSDGGEFGGVDYVVHESPLTENPYTANPDTVKPDTANPTQVSIEGVVSNETPARNETSLITSGDVNDAFEVFWNAGMRKTGKAKAKAKFEAICKTKKLQPTAFAEQLRADVIARIKAGQFGFDKLHPLTYLNGERWTDEIVNERQDNVHYLDNRPRPKHSGLDQANDTGLTRRADGTYSL